MADHRIRGAALLGLVAALLLLVALPSAAFAAAGPQHGIDRVAIADVPGTGGEDCVEDPDLHPGTGLRECPKGFDIFSLLPFVAGGVVVLLAVGVGWFLVMRRRASRPFLPDQAVAGAGAGAGVSAGSGAAASGEWWTCKNCGSTNMICSARCYKCGSWAR